MPLTLEEQERFAYIEGRTGEAAVLALAIDAENDALDEMRHERDTAKQDADDYYRQKEELESVAEIAEEKVLTLTSELENAQDEIKALQGQIIASGVDLV